jgi:hypothetical protein
MWGMRYLALPLCVSALAAQPSEAPAPGFKLLRYEEDYRYLADPQRQTDPLDAIKFLPLASNENWFLSIGGEIRERGEYFDHSSWGKDPPDSGYLLQRYMLHVDLHLGNCFRLFGELKSGIESGRDGGPRPIDQDELDVNQAFVDACISTGGRTKVTVRLGRQEISLGSSRLVSVRDGPNVRQSFDGARLILDSGAWHIDALATKPVQTNRGVFDDSPDHARSFWGVYAVRPIRLLPGGHIDLYYLGLDRKRAVFDKGIGREQRHSIGTRLWGEAEGWDYNYEAIYQWGRFGPGNIRAWTVASDMGYRIALVPLRPRFGLKADVTSGTQDPRSQTLGTFNALFPKGAYFSEADLLGPYNHIDIHPSIEFEIRKNVSLTPDADFFWRESLHDGIYGVAGNLLKAGQKSDARYIGSHVAAQIEWRANRHLTYTAMYLHFFPGAFLRETPPGLGVNFVATWLTYKF